MVHKKGEIMGVISFLSDFFSLGEDRAPQKTTLTSTELISWSDALKSLYRLPRKKLYKGFYWRRAIK